MPDTHTPLWKQLLGAGVGAIVAVLLYGGFTVAMEYLPASLSGVTDAKVSNTAASAAPALAPGARALVDRARQIVAEKKVQMDDVSDDADDVPVTLPAAFHAAAAHSSGQMSSAASVAKAAPKIHTGAPSQIVVRSRSTALPNSGIGMWAGMGVAFAVAAAVHRRSAAAENPLKR